MGSSLERVVPTALDKRVEVTAVEDIGKDQTRGMMIQLKIHHKSFSLRQLTFIIMMNRPFLISRKQEITQYSKTSLIQISKNASKNPRHSMTSPYRYRIVFKKSKFPFRAKALTNVISPVKKLFHGIASSITILPRRSKSVGMKNQLVSRGT